PQLGLREEFLLEEIAKRRHRRAVESGAQPVVDILDSTSSIEAPVLVQVRCEHRVSGVILERWRRGTITAALIAVAFAAADRVIKLPPHLQGVGTSAAPRLLAEHQ